ncbi:phosphotransferase family protein [Streptomyces beijiangensis]|uniref:Phosphotransferase n=1 Tax=Streptomyces beijiangensis TaxID=163361 RepID=A0A939F8X8_9ACTN|nr:phosphotransferase [Streptomyces beijiangensis]MBO0512655.1 phosphotransferase [Streptomyces beijiangensis]
MQRQLKHGYTNHTVTDGTVVVKTYAGPDAELRLDREHRLLTRLRGQLPVPPVHAADAGTLTLGFLAGVPGQDLLGAGHAAEVLRACGELLSRIHGVDAPHESGTVLVHGDFGPHNVLLDPVTFEITAVVDWEFAHSGDPVQDLAWCEWIVRMHHSEHRTALGHFFRAYARDVPAWPQRKAAMLARCEALRQFCHRWELDGPGVRQWRDRAAATAAWVE